MKEKTKQKTQAQRAKELGISPAYFCQLTTGVVKISEKRAYKWSKEIGRIMDWWMSASPDQIKNELMKGKD